MQYTKKEIEQMSDTERRALAMSNAWGTRFEKCPNCGVYKERQYICWNCDFDE